MIYRSFTHYFHLLQRPWIERVRAAVELYKSIREVNLSNLVCYLVLAEVSPIFSRLYVDIWHSHILTCLLTHNS